MKKLPIALLIMAMVGVMSVSCDKEEDDPTDSKPEFVANSTSFADWKNWSKDASNTGPDPSLGSAHSGNDATVVRDVYYKDGQDKVNGKYPVGTLIFKNSHNPGGTVKEYFGMAKRGGDFNNTGGNWEYFVLNEDGSFQENAGVPLRGGLNFLNGMCSGCHAGAAAKDYIYTKP